VRRRQTVLVAGFLSVAVLVGVVACSHELAIDDWLARADDICRQAQQAADANPAPQSPLPGDVLRLTASRSQAELDKLKDLDQPAENKQAVAEYLLTLGHRIDELGNYADAIDKAPAQGPAPDRTHLEDLTSEAFTEGVALGLNDCNGGVDFSIDNTTTSSADPLGSVPISTVPGGPPQSEDNTEDSPGT
jgi:hypothetical protein